MANNLSMIRKALGLTQPKLAELMGTTKNQLIKLERGDRRLTQAWIEKAAEVTGIAIEKFVMEGLSEADIRPPSGGADPASLDEEWAGWEKKLKDAGQLETAKAIVRALLSGGTPDAPPPVEQEKASSKARKAE